MAGESCRSNPVAHAVGGRIQPTDDVRGGSKAVIRIHGSRFTPAATAGLDAFATWRSSSGSTRHSSAGTGSCSQLHGQP